MGRRRISRRQLRSRATPGIAVNDESSTDTESGSPVNVARSETPALRPMQNSPVRTSNRFTPIEEINVVASEASVGSNPAQNRLSFPPPPSTVPTAEFSLHNPGNGDEQVYVTGSNATQANPDFQTLFQNSLKEANIQNRAMINECMTGTANMMKECMMGIADMTRNNFQDLLHALRSNDDNTRPQPQSSSSTSQQENGIQRAVITSCMPPDPTVVTSLAQYHTDTFVTQSRLPSVTATVSRDSNHRNPFPSGSSNPYDQVAMPRLNNSGTNSQHSQIESPASFPNAPCLNKSQSVRLPPFTGSSNDSWKVWHARFTTVANLNRWDETTRLSELMQRMQGTAAEFVFDEIPTDILNSYASLVDELDSRFKSVETNRTFRVQFSKRMQKYDESIEEYAAELKRIYDKAYPGRNPEMRRQLLLQQFLSGLKDKEAKFAVEYYKEPNSLEEAVHHVVTYIEAQQGSKSQNRQNSRSQRKSLRFEHDDDDDDEDDVYEYNCTSGSRARSVSQSKKQSLQKVNDKPTNAMPVSCSPDSEILQKILTLVETANNNPNKGHDQQGQKGQGHTNVPLVQYNQSSNGQGQAQVIPTANYASQRSNLGNRQGQGQMNGQGQLQGQGRHATLKCFYCSEIGHIKRNCPVLKAEQAQNLHPSSKQHPRPAPLIPYYGLPQSNPNFIDLN